MPPKFPNQESQFPKTPEGEPEITTIDIAEALAQMEQTGRSITRLLNRAEILDGATDAIMRSTELSARNTAAQRSA